jgi:RES domain-containing protein
VRPSDDHDAKHAERTRQLAKFTQDLSHYSRLLGEDGAPGEFMPSDFGQLSAWKRKIDRYLGDSSSRQLLISSAVTSGLPRYAEYGDWYRLTPAYFISNVLTATNEASRFHAGRLLAQTERFTTLYLASDITTASLEFPPGVFVPVRIRVELQNVADLTDPDVLEKRLGISIRQLIEPWPRTTVGFTHEIGAALYRAGYEAFKVPSAVRFGKANLVVLPQNLRRNSVVAVSAYEPSMLRIPGWSGA